MDRCQHPANPRVARPSRARPRPIWYSSELWPLGAGERGPEYELLFAKQRFHAESVVFQNSSAPFLEPRVWLRRSCRGHTINSWIGVPVSSSNELAIFKGRPMGCMYSCRQSMPKALYIVAKRSPIETIRSAT